MILLFSTWEIGFWIIICFTIFEFVSIWGVKENKLWYSHGISYGITINNICTIPIIISHTRICDHMKHKGKKNSDAPMEWATVALWRIWNDTRTTLIYGTSQKDKQEQTPEGLMTRKFMSKVGNVIKIMQ